MHNQPEIFEQVPMKAYREVIFVIHTGLIIS